MIKTASPLAGPQYPFDLGFYTKLIARRGEFKMVSEVEIPGPGAYGTSVRAGQAWRVVAIERPNALDLCVCNAQDPAEHYAPGSQLAIEGGYITRLTRIWGTPPNSRPLCTVLADTFPARPNERHLRDHTSHAAHCNAHHWMLYTGTHPPTCYDNLRDAYAMVGLSQLRIHDNFNVFFNSTVDPQTGLFIYEEGQGTHGDYLEFYAEIDQIVAVSVCPYGGGITDNDKWSTTIATYPVRFEVFDTGVAPLGWSQPSLKYYESAPATVSSSERADSV